MSVTISPTKFRPQVEAPCYQLDSFKNEVSIRCNRKMVEDVVEVLDKVPGKNEEVFSIFTELKNLSDTGRVDSVIVDHDGTDNEASWTVGFTGRQCYIFIPFPLLNALSKDLSIAYIKGVSINHAVHSFKTRAENMVISSENRIHNFGYSLKN